VSRTGNKLHNCHALGTALHPKAAKTVRCAKRREADIGNIRERCDKEARRFSFAFVQGISGTGHYDFPAA
jgi:hypothetical protein